MKNHKLVGCITTMKAFGVIKTRFFHVNEETGDVKDVTLELCKAVLKFNDVSKSIKNEGKYAKIIPYQYKDGIAEYSHGCGLSHYLHESDFEQIMQIASDVLTFPLDECNISMYTPSDVKDILECKSVFDTKIESCIQERYSKVLITGR